MMMMMTMMMIWGWCLGLLVVPLLLLNIDIPNLLIYVHQLTLVDTNNNSNFIDGFAGSLRDRQTGLDPDVSRADSLHVSGCTPQLEFDATTSIATNGRIPISKGQQASSGKGKFQLITDR